MPRMVGKGTVEKVAFAIPGSKWVLQRQRKLGLFKEWLLVQTI